MTRLEIRNSVAGSVDNLPSTNIALTYRTSHSEELLGATSQDSSFDINNYNTDDLEVTVSDNSDNSDTPNLHINDNFVQLDDYQQLAPPKELDPSKLYALYAFMGTDPAYCRLKQDEDCILLNDEDAYWWLVKRCKDGTIGFAPAEILETYRERLARLNSWKNEQSLLNQIRYGPSHQQNLKNYKKSQKSVSFSDVISYAEDTSTTDIPLHDTQQVLTDSILNLTESDTMTLRQQRIQYNDTKTTLHPYIAKLYSPVFTQVDDMLQKLNSWAA